MTETVITNARVVMADQDFVGTVTVRDGRIVAVDQGPSALPRALDFEGDYLLPGFVELHTDNLERHFAPRPGVQWPPRASVVAHDAQIAAAGITTVFDALAIGDVFEGSHRITQLAGMCQGIIGACEAGILRAEHFLHLRCELSFAHALEIFETLMDHRAVKLVSLMDHTPGDRQFVNVERYRFYYMKKYNMSDEQFQAFYARRRDDQERYSARHRAAIVERARTRKHVLASHDDATLDHVDEAIRDGITIAEFPTTFEAARAAHQRGLAVLAGGPNILLGGSHSGNVAVCDLAAQGILDIVSSDYVPSSIVQAAFALVDAGVGLDIAGAIRLISHNPAEAAGLCDRGAIAPGLRADLVRVRRVDGMPIVVSVWRASERIV